jgi:hypothetical protein
MTVTDRTGTFVILPPGRVRISRRPAGHDTERGADSLLALRRVARKTYQEDRHGDTCGPAQGDPALLRPRPR